MGGDYYQICIFLIVNTLYFTQHLFKPEDVLHFSWHHKAAEL
jgi:hypothetical protein